MHAVDKVDDVDPFLGLCLSLCWDQCIQEPGKGRILLCFINVCMRAWLIVHVGMDQDRLSNFVPSLKMGLTPMGRTEWANKNGRLVLASQSRVALTSVAIDDGQ